MKQLITNIYSIITQIILLLIATYWYIKSKEIEALLTLCGIIFTIGSTLFYRKYLRNRKKIKSSRSIKLNGNDNIVNQYIKNSKIKINKSSTDEAK